MSETAYYEQANNWINKNSSDGFIENKGQMKDINGDPVPNVLFKTEAPGMNYWITEEGITIQTFKIEEKEGKEELEIFWERVDIRLKGGDIKKENIIKSDPVYGELNYFQPNNPDGVTGVKTYQKITIENVYNGIDWHFYRKDDGTIKYDFIVHPYGDEEEIELVYLSKTPVKLNKEGDLEVKTKYGNIKENKPISFYSGNEISTDFVLTSLLKEGFNGEKCFESKLFFQLKEIPKKRNTALIIDPELVWGTFYGGNTIQGPMSVKVDSDGNLFVGGYVTISPDFPVLDPGTGAYFDGVLGGNQDAFILKFDEFGVRQWASLYGGSQHEKLFSICINEEGDIFLTGNTLSPDFPVMDAGGGAYFDALLNGAYDVFVVKFDNDGFREWATYLGGAGGYPEEAHSVCVDNEQNLYITGVTSSADFPLLDAGGYFDGTLNGWCDVFIVKFNDSGILEWGTLYGGGDASYYEIGHAISTDNDGNIFLTGITTSDDFPLFDAGGGAYFDPELGNFYDPFILKFNNELEREWATFFGGESEVTMEYGHSISIDSEGNVFISGKTGASDFPVLDPGAGAYYETTYSGEALDIFLSKFNNSGIYLWGTMIHASDPLDGNDTYEQLAINSCDEVYLSFQTSLESLGSESSCDGGYEVDTPNGRDLYLMKFNTNNNLIWSTYVGGDGGDKRSPITVDLNDNLYLCGEWTGVISALSYPLEDLGGLSYFDDSENGEEDVCILKFSPLPPTYEQDFINDLDCSCSGEATATILDGCAPYTFNWSTGDTYTGDESTHTLTGLCAGDYWVEAIGSCMQIDTLYYTIIEEVCGLNITIPDDTICIGDCIDLISEVSGEEGDLTFEWPHDPAETGGTITVCPVETTTYQVIVFDELDSDTTEVTITVLPYPEVNLGNDTTLCPEETLLLDAENPEATFLWQDGSTAQTFEVNTTGTYYVTVDNGGCTSSDTINIMYVDLSVDLGPDQEVCELVDIILDAENAAASFLWQDGASDQTYVVTELGTYYVDVTDENGCMVSDTVTFSEGTIEVDLGNDTILCNLEPLLLNAGIPGATYNWDDGSTDQTRVVSTTGSYWVDVNQGFCSGTDTIHVSFSDPLAQFSVSDTTGCAPQEVNFSDFSVAPEGITSWFWEFGDGTTSTLQHPSHTYPTNGSYDVKLTITTTLGCVAESERTITVEIYLYPIAAFIFDPTAPLVEEAVYFTDQSINAWEWEWDFGDGNGASEQNPIHTYTNNGNYTITLTVDNHGCIDSTFGTLIIEEPLIFYVPNVFTPDGNQFNEVFKPVFTSGFDPYDYHLSIYNRWGELVFESYNHTIGWDGTYGNKGLVQDGVYIWQITFGDINNDKKYTERGHVSVLR